ncbi:MAG: hypothetical protein SLAVMIC_00750 [uncultured marine phage]|uniref:Uncharacterized protein n=1 Tax=uncultured marine phage TaxID=707152 RepID=A0A8D9FSE1_9VIRU|nr:MAG: hypothetical protein SLAVMIC_00750 [uncultured marine phage]
MTIKEFYTKFNKIITISSDIKGNLESLLKSIKGTKIEKIVGDINIDKILTDIKNKKTYKKVDVMETQSDGFYTDDEDYEDVDEDYDWEI